jgi:hypothetical protein
LRSKKTNENPKKKDTETKKFVEAKKTSDTTPKKIPEKKNSETPPKRAHESLPRIDQSEVVSTSQPSTSAYNIFTDKPKL